MIDVLNSITNTQSTVYDDSQSPYNILEWIEKTSGDAGSVDRYISNYNDYIRQWRTVSNNSTIKNDITIKDTYIRFLQEIVLKYTTQEEKRYLNNIDLTDADEADAAIPFFATRIREIIETIYRNRQQAKFQKIKHSMRGGSKGLEKIIYDQLIRYVSNENVVNHDLPNLEYTAKNTRVRVIETYDLAQHYFDTQYMYTAGDEFVDENGHDYVGYYHEVLLNDGRKLLSSGKTQSDPASRFIAPALAGSVYSCSSIKIDRIYITDNNLVKIQVSTSSCDHWSYSVDQATSVDVHDSSDVILQLSPGVHQIKVFCVDADEVIKSTDTAHVNMIDLSTGDMTLENGGRVMLERFPQYFLLWESPPQYELSNQ